MSVSRYNWQPGDMTRYDLILSKLDDGCMLLSWMCLGGSGGKSFKFSPDSFVHWSYLAEKMDLREGATPGLLCFIECLGVKVGFPEWFTKEKSLELDKYEVMTEKYFPGY